MHPQGIVNVGTPDPRVMDVGVGVDVVTRFFFEEVYKMNEMFLWASRPARWECEALETELKRKYQGLVTEIEKIERTPLGHEWGLFIGGYPRRTQGGNG